MASAHPGSYNLPPPQNMHNDFRLPSLKELNFHQYKRQDAPPPTSPTDVHREHQRPVPVQAQPQPQPQPQLRHEPAPWTRPGSQHGAPAPPLPVQQRPAEYPATKQDGYLTPGVPLSVQTAPAPGSVTSGPPPGAREEPTHSSVKRSRSGSAVSASPGRSPHTVYPSHPPPYAPQTGYQVQAPGPPYSQPIQHPGPYPHPPPPGYAPYPPQYVQQQRPPHPPVVAHHAQQVVHVQPHYSPHGVPYPPQPPPEHWQHHGAHPQPHPVAPHPPVPQQQQQHSHPQPQPHPQPQHQQQPQPQHQPQHQSQHQSHPQLHPHAQAQQGPPPAPPPHAQYQDQVPPQSPMHYVYARTTALVPKNLDAQTAQMYAVQETPQNASARNDVLRELVQHCRVLYEFAHRYASHPQAQPPQAELSEMASRAAQVVRLVEALKRLTQNQDEVQAAQTDVLASAVDPSSSGGSAGGSRPPKRPWEDMSTEDDAGEGHAQAQGQGSDGNHPLPLTSTAEQDMEIIRSKRASSTGGPSVPGQPKSKYRKRSRATPPGKCHSCNISETPEWRRGPDGARTLCNACGLHYAKLMRRREKAIAEGQVHAGHPIDLETLKASAATRVMNEAGREESSSHSPIQPQAPLQSQSQSQSQPQEYRDSSSNHGQNQKTIPSPAQTLAQVHSPHVSLSGPGQGPYQLVPVNTSRVAGGAGQVSSPVHSSPQQMMHPPSGPSSGEQQQHHIGVPPPPPWQTAARVSYQSDHATSPPQPQHHSYVRNAAHLSNARTAPA